MMKYFLLQLLCLATTLVSASSDGFERDQGIVVLKGDNFQKALDHFDNILVEFYAPWCGHCKAFADDYVKVAAVLQEKGENVVCAKVDATEEQDFIEKYDIQGSPTLKLFRKDKKPDSYQGFRSVDALVDWVTRKIEPSALMLEDSETAEKFKDSADVAIVGHSNNAVSNESLTFSDNENQYDNFKFCSFHTEDATSKLGFTKEGVKLFKKFNEGEVDYDKDLKSVSELKRFNRNMFLPLIKSIVEMDYFRYVKISLNRSCELWCNADKCNLRDCQVKTFSDPEECPISNYENTNELATVNTDLNTDQLDLLTKLFECNDNDDHDAQYVDLLLNPERFTGYSGESAHRIWRAIYEENCFVSKLQSPFEQELCYEERLFYEAISGLHTSINIHLCAEYPSNAMFGSFEPNLKEFLRRFENHSDYIENLYKLYFMELRALAKCKPYLVKRVNWPDSSTKNAIHDLLNVVEKFNIPMFQDFSLKPSHVSHQLAMRFRNITTTIINCVACDKCKLWGKVQLRGLGTALKILSVKDFSKFHLNHQEISSLVNALARLAHSIRNLEQFHDLYEEFKRKKKRAIDSGKESTLMSDDCKLDLDIFK